MSDRTLARGITLGAALGVFALAVGMLARLLTLGDWPRTWDDSFMFVRYADNLRLHGVLAWNPGAAPAYGLTSVLYVAVVLPVRLVVSSPVLAIMLSSAISGAAALILLLALLRGHTQTGDPVARAAGVALVIGTLVAAREMILAHVLSGMDTLFAMAYLAAYFLLVRRAAAQPTRNRLIVAGVWGGLAFFVRPDLLLFAALIPLAMLVLGPDRRAAIVLLIVSGGVVGVELLLARLAFGTWLPLPFYLKSASHIYGPYFESLYVQRPWEELQRFLGAYWPLIVPIGLAVMAGPRAWWRETDAIDKGMLVAALLFVLYYLFFVMQIMPYEARFYHPALPALAYLGARATAHLIERGRAWIDSESGRRTAGILTGGAALLLLFGIAGTALAGELVALQRAAGDFDPAIYDPAEVYRRTGYHNYWYALDEFSALPEELTMATTEVGLPAALNPRRQIVDLSGLNEASIALHGFDADRILTDYRPDLVYMPNPDYNEIINSLTRSAVFNAEYELFAAQDLEAVMAVALRRASPDYDAMRAIVARRVPAE